MFTRRPAEDVLLDKARKRVAGLSKNAALEWGVVVSGYVMRIFEQHPATVHTEDDLGELDTAIAALRAIRERLGPG
ncbi:hypothetical protein AB0F77_05995 [Streptomyces sp. NPDC026672]|uniref:hypothetical protein n=1 Tax=unclassified Streptomyces TaxID=2593676 RepID=UPI0033DF4244